MSRFARLAKSKSKPEVVPIAPPFSNFEFVDREFSGLASLRRIMSQVRQHGGNTMVLEDVAIEDADDLLEENADLNKYVGCTFSSKAIRLSFFRKQFTTLRGLSAIDCKDFIGYAIVKLDDLPMGCDKARVYESVIRTSRHINNFVRGEQEWTCAVAGNNIAVKGYLHAQQNGATNVCAHVALRTVAARFHKDGDMTYREMNNLPGIKIDHLIRKAGGPNGLGLNQNQMVEVLKAAGANPIKVEYSGEDEKANSLPPFQKYLYGSIESGFPAIICFWTSGDFYHAIPVFGHTFNEDTWVPSAELDYFSKGAGPKCIPSESWLSTFIGHDDNWGSNFCIPRDFLYTQKYCDKMVGKPGPCKKQEERVFCVIATLPKGVKISAPKAEAIGANYLFSMLQQLPAVSGPWQERLDWYAQHNRLVLRPVLIDGPQYASHLAKLADWYKDRFAPVKVEILAKGLPRKKLWLIELSVPELFSTNRRKIAEVLIQAEVSERSRKSFVVARLPGCFAFLKKGSPSRPLFGFVPSGAEGHVPLFGSE